jgi:dihydroorotase
MSDSAKTQAILVQGGRVVDSANGYDGIADVLVEDGVVTRVAPGIAGDGAYVVDARGCIVSPGFVDLHAHLREPGFEQKGTIASETRAALLGGFTTVCAMPNTNPPPDSASAVSALRERFLRDGHVRVLPVGCTTKGRAGTEVAELGELAEAGCVAFSDDGNPVANSVAMRSALLLAGALGLPISEHSDDPVLNAGGSMNEGRVSERLGLAGQPAAAEVTAVARNIALAEATGAHMHIAHVTTARAVELVADAKARGVRVTCEVTPSHLLLTEDAVFGAGPAPAYDTNAKINPPLRTEADRQALLRGLNAGVIDCIATDHAPHATEDKQCEFDQAAPGISCFETALATVTTLVARGELELTTALRALTAGPVRAWALERYVPGAGALTPGVASDLVVIDPADVWVVDTAAFASKGRNTPLQGVTLTGRARAVVVRGDLAFEREVAHA